ncbi:MAG TPA: VOC family protein [Pseudorhizobium sp.]|nr:VOC family protein [Pseudorhizobium sp.]
MAKMIHSMIRVLDEKRSVEFYEKAFGLKVAERVPFDGFTLIYLANAETGFELELTVNAGRDKPYDLGDGYGHLAVSVEDVEAEYKRFSDLGLTVGKLVDMPRDGKPFARFFFATDPDGYKIEVLQRGGRFS